MKLIEDISEKEFNKFKKKSTYDHPYQSIKWKTFKSEGAWTSHLIGFEESKELVAACVLLIRPVPGLSKKFIYIPRGILMDYSNKKHIKEITNLLKEYAKKEKAFLVTIDPTIIEKEYLEEEIKINKEGQEIKETLFASGFKEAEKEKKHGEYKEIQPRYSLYLNLKNPEEILKEMDRKIRYLVNFAIKSNCLIFKEGKKEDLKTFTDISSFTAHRNNFLGRKEGYFKRLYDTEGENLDMFFVYVDIKKGLEEFSKEERNSKKNKEIYEELLKHKDQKELLVSAAMFLKGTKEVLYLYSASNNHFRNLNPNHFMQWKIIERYANEGYKKYDLRGGVPNPKSSMYGLYLFKKGFASNIVSYIGECDLVINKGTYIIWKTVLPKVKEALKILRQIKNKS